MSHTFFSTSFYLINVTNIYNKYVITIYNKNFCGTYVYLHIKNTI